MGTRTDILQVATSLRALAAKSPSVARDLQPMIIELEACAERADKKRLEKKKAVKELLTTLQQQPTPTPSMAPKANFLSTVVMPRLTDRALNVQVAEYERALTAYFQTMQAMSNLTSARSASIEAIARNLR